MRRAPMVSTGPTDFTWVSLATLIVCAILIGGIYWRIWRDRRDANDDGA